jgi:ABC-type multidrug transport system permease subunit
MAGFRADAGQFFTFFAVVLLMQYVTVAFSTFAVALFRDFPTASLVTNLSFTFQVYLCGFFVQVQNLPVYLRWARWMAYMVFSAYR